MNQDQTNDEFVSYLLMVAEDYEESGSTATAEDYREAARRIKEIVFLEQAAYEGGMHDGIAKGGC